MKNTVSRQEHRRDLGCMGWNLLKRLGLTALALVQNVYLLDHAVTKTKIPVAHCRSCGWVFFCKKLEIQTKWWYLPLFPILTKLELVLFLLITRLYYLGRESEVHLNCINHSLNKIKDAAASLLYQCNNLFTERIVLHAFSSPTVKTSHNYGEKLCKPVHVWVRSLCKRKNSPVISVIFMPPSVLLWPLFSLSLMNYFGLFLLLQIYPFVSPGKAFKITAPITCLTSLACHSILLQARHSLWWLTGAQRQLGLL